MRRQIVKMVWMTVERIRVQLRPMIAGTGLHRFLKIPSQFIRRHTDDYRDRYKDSIFCRESEMAACSHQPDKVLDLMIKRFGPKTVLDLGCGTGKAIDYLLSQGIDAFGIEGSALAISKSSFPQRMTQANLNEPVCLNRKFDAVFCYEVVEHIHPDYLESLMATLCSHSDLIILSHAQPGQGGEGHFNEQPDDYWIKQFSRMNFEIDRAATQEFKNCGDLYANNLMVFRKSSK